jgi:hypothetical protein
MLKKVRRLPSPALVISALALIVAVGGGSFALASLNGGKVKKIAKRAANKQITKRAPGLSVRRATTAANATNATNASQLGGVPASGYTQSGCGALTGQIKGFARINVAQVSSSFSTNGVEVPYNCSGGTVEARVFNGNVTEVRFNDSPVGFALASVLYGPTEQEHVNVNLSVKNESPGLFRVDATTGGGSAASEPFVILTP